jgi:hypothetical protein
LVPLDARLEAVLRTVCSGRLSAWDPYLKAAQVYDPPFVEFDLEVGKGYELWLDEVPDAVSHEGNNPQGHSETKLGRSGWAWVGLPGLAPIEGGDFMNSVLVKYPSDGSGSVRNAAGDRASAEPWVNWEWWLCDAQNQTAKSFTPYARFGNTACMPWVGYRCYVNVGTAEREADPDQVTLIWPSR